MKLHVIALVFLLGTLASADKDYYKIMGIPRTADEKAIKKAYRRLAAQLHPDQHGGDPVYAEKYRDVNEAYEVLKDKDKRRVYDRNGEKGVKEYEQQKAQGHGEDMFSSFFGHGQAEERTGPKMFMKLRVTLEDVYNGRELRIQYNRDKICPHCRGSGADDPSYIHECGACNGKGVVYQRVQIMPGWFQNAEVEQGRLKVDVTSVMEVEDSLGKHAIFALGPQMLRIQKQLWCSSKEALKMETKSLTQKRLTNILTTKLEIQCSRSESCNTRSSDGRAMTSRWTQPSLLKTQTERNKLGVTWIQERADSPGWETTRDSEARQSHLGWGQAETEIKRNAISRRQLQVRGLDSDVVGRFLWASQSKFVGLRE